MFSDNLTQLAKLENFIRLGSLEHCDRLLSTVLQFIWRAATSINKNKLQIIPLSKNLFCFQRVTKYFMAK